MWEVVEVAAVYGVAPGMGSGPPAPWDVWAKAGGRDLGSWLHM